MTSNDAQIDLLLRRHAQRPASERPKEHLDADELNAFAEGVLPTASRARFVSHLADCDDCRKLATSLVNSSRTAPVSQVAGGIESGSWREWLAGLFAPTRLRYAAFALVLIAAAGITFVAFRNKQARRVTESNAPLTAIATDQRSVTDQVKQQPNFSESSAAKATPLVSRPAAQPTVGMKAGESVVVQNTQPEAKVLKEPAAADREAATPPAVASKSENVPAYAPPPPAESERAQKTAQYKSRDQQTIGGVASRKDDLANTNFGTLDRSRSEVQSNRSTNQSGVAGNIQQAAPSNTQQSASVSHQAVVNERGATDEKVVANAQEANAATVTSANAIELRKSAPKAKEQAKRGITTKRDGSEEAVQIRSAGGRKFRRQGAAWIDVKFKPSMTIKSIARGSDDYRALDGGIRSIAEQLGGDVLIVWKGKAYRIQ